MFTKRIEHFITQLVQEDSYRWEQICDMVVDRFADEVDEDKIYDILDAYEQLNE